MQSLAYSAIKEKLLELDQKIMNEEKERKLARLKQIELEASRSSAEQAMRERMEKRKIEAEKEKRRKEREEKRRIK